MGEEGESALRVGLYTSPGLRSVPWILFIWEYHTEDAIELGSSNNGNQRWFCI